MSRQIEASRIRQESLEFVRSCDFTQPLTAEHKDRLVTFLQDEINDARRHIEACEDESRNLGDQIVQLQHQIPERSFLPWKTARLEQAHSEKVAQLHDDMRAKNQDANHWRNHREEMNGYLQQVDYAPLKHVEPRPTLAADLPAIAKTTLTQHRDL